MARAKVADKRKPPPHGKYAAKYDPVEVYLCATSIGSSQAAPLHRLHPRTVYRVIHRVENTPELLAEAEARRAKRAEQFELTIATLRDAAFDALHSRIMTGRLSDRALVGLLQYVAPKPSDAPTQTHAVVLPDSLTTPRVDTESPSGS